MERSASILPYAYCFASTFMCVYVLCLYIHMKSSCLGLELYERDKWNSFGQTEISIQWLH